MYRIKFNGKSVEKIPVGDSKAYIDATPIEKEIAELEAANQRLKNQNEKDFKALAKLKRDDRKTQINQLKQQNNELHAEVARLKGLLNTFAVMAHEQDAKPLDVSAAEEKASSLKRTQQDADAPSPNNLQEFSNVLQKIGLFEQVRPDSSDATEKATETKAAKSMKLGGSDSE